MTDEPCKSVTDDNNGCKEDQYCVQARQKVFNVTLGENEDNEIPIPVCIDKSLWEEKFNGGSGSTNPTTEPTSQTYEPILDNGLFLLTR